MDPKVVIDNNKMHSSIPHIDDTGLDSAPSVELADIIRAQAAAIDELTAKMANYEETIAYLTRKLYGRSKEDATIVGQLSLFNEAEVELPPSPEEPDLDELLGEKEKQNPKKKRSTHDEMLGNIPVEKVVLRLKGEDRICEWCGNEMDVLGEKYVREELHVVPAKLKRVKIYQEVLICNHCKQEADEPVIIAPAAPEPVIPESMASPSSISWLIIEKYMKHVPLYRLEQQLKQDGVKLSRGTMANWLIKVTEEYMEPLYKALIHEQLKRDILHADETTCQVLKEPGRKATQKSYIWLYTTGNDGGPPILIYDYHPSRAHTVPVDYLKDWHGYLHTDCYDGYNALEDFLTRCTCWAHLRRYWYDAVPTELQKSVEKGTIKRENIGPAATGFLYCDRLFEIDRKLKGLTADERYQKRLELELPIINKFFAWVNELTPLGGSKLETAVNYTKNHEKTLRNYLKDGRLSLDNNRAERAAKTYVMGRKGFLFHDTTKGAHSSSVLYSLVETAKANNLNVYKYMWFILQSMSGDKRRLGNIEQYLPWTDLVQSRCHISVAGTDEEETYD